jgi:glutathione synthase
MQRIFPPVNRTLCLRRGEMVELETLSELGVYGGYVRVGDTVTRNAHGGHLLRTKAATSDEGGVAAGFAVLDSVRLE